MKDSIIAEDILYSWRKCMNIGLASNTSSPAIHVAEKAIGGESYPNSSMLSLFKECVNSLFSLVTKERYFLMTDSKGIILSSIKKNSIKALFTAGMSFAEESSGTNAIALALKYNKTVYTLPEHHYCAFLNKIYILAAPLLDKENIAGAIALISEKQPISKELIVIVKLLSYKISMELSGIQKEDSSAQKSTERFKTGNTESSIRLNEKQLSVIKLLARGLTDKAAAVSMGVSIDTIRYHKRVIFKKLNAGSILEAIIISLKLGLISIDNI